MMFMWAFICLMLAPSFDAHDFHLSRCDIVYRSETAVLEITQHIFIDDLELALKEYYSDPINLCTDFEIDDADQLVKTYVEDHLEITLDGQVLAVAYLGKEPADDPMAMWVYIEALNVPSFSSGEVRYDLLFEVHSDQKNILSFKRAGEKQQMFLLDEGTPSATIEH